MFKMVSTTNRNIAIQNEKMMQRKIFTTRVFIFQSPIKSMRLKIKRFITEDFSFKNHFIYQTKVKLKHFLPEGCFSLLTETR